MRHPMEKHAPGEEKERDRDERRTQLYEPLPGGLQHHRHGEEQGQKNEEDQETRVQPLLQAQGCQAEHPLAQVALLEEFHQAEKQPGEQGQKETAGRHGEYSSLHRTHDIRI